MNSERLLNTFFDLVRIDCPSGHEGAAAAYCREALEAAGCTVHTDNAAQQTGADTGNLCAVLPGTLPGAVMMTAHLDCVQPCEGVEPLVDDGVIHTDGTTVLGGDDKVGVASIIEAVRCLHEEDVEHVTVKVFFSTGEEVGCLGAKAADRSFFTEGDPCYVFDMDGTPGAAVLAAPYHYTFKAQFTGKASHAGVAPSDGISAVEAASRAIVWASEHGWIGAIGKHGASNFGTIVGGTANNVVPATCTLTGECRAIKRSKVEKIRAGLDAALNAGAESVAARVEVAWKLEYAGFVLKKDAPVAQRYLRAVEAAGLEPDFTRSLGGSDANVYANYGVDTLVVATGMTGFHSVGETLKVADLENTARVAYALGTVSAS